MQMCSRNHDEVVFDEGTSECPVCALMSRLADVEDDLSDMEHDKDEWEENYNDREAECVELKDKICAMESHINELLMDLAELKQPKEAPK